MLKEEKNTEYVTAWKSKRLFQTKICALHNVFLPNIKQFEYKIGIQFNNKPLVIDKDISYPRNSFNNFTLKNFLFGASNIVKIAIKFSIFIVTVEQRLTE